MSAVQRPALPLVDWGKALASQLIIWHHLAWYGPMAVAAGVLAPELLDWLRGSARLAVQVFLVLGGFLAARSLAPRPWDVTGPRPAALPRLLAQRYLRLARPYGAALLAALLAAWVARTLGADADTPAAPTELQLLANLLFLQDLLGEPALSAGFWYVAIDLQLFALLAALVALRRIGARGSRLNRVMRQASLLGTVSLTLLSLLWLNLMPELDVVAPYFFGAYGLGVLAQWVHAQPRRGGLLLALAALVGLALCVEWRSRVAVAGATALLLAAQPAAARLQASRLQPLMAWLARTSYASFLMHYPILLALGALADHVWPGSVGMAVAGLLAAWGLSLGAGALVYRHIERAAPRSQATAQAARRWVAQRP